MTVLFSELRFPEDISYGAIGGPQFSTGVVSSKSGYEYRNINWEHSRIKYNVAYGIKNENQLEKLISFFRVHYGKAIGFRFKDWSDYKLIDGTIDLHAIENGKFHITKHYKVGALLSKRKISKPVEGTVNIKVNNSSLVDEEFSVNYSTGLVTLTKKVTSSDVIDIACEFDVPMRFATDFLPCAIENYNFYQIRDLELLEIKL